MPLVEPTTVPPETSLQIPAGNPTALDLAEAELHQKRVISLEYEAADAEQVQPAKRYTYDVERGLAVSDPGVLPPQLPQGAPEWAQLLVQGQADIRASLTEITGLDIRASLTNITSEITALSAKVDTLIERVDALEKSTSHERMIALIKNGSCLAREDSPLVPVPHKRTGDMPPKVFPGTLGGKYCNFNVIFLLNF